MYQIIYSQQGSGPTYGTKLAARKALLSGPYHIVLSGVMEMYRHNVTGELAYIIRKVEI